MKVSMSLLIVATALSLASCRNKDYVDHTKKEDTSKLTSNLSAEESASLKTKIQEMFRSSIMSYEGAEANGCKQSYEALVVSLKDSDSERITYTKEIKSIVSSECTETQQLDPNKEYVAVSPGDGCEDTFEKEGDIVKVKSCIDGEITTVNMKERTAEGTSKTGKTTIKSIALDAEGLKKSLENVKIIYFSKGEDNTSVQDKEEIGDALSILNITL